MIVVMVVDGWDQPFNGTVVSSRRFAEALLARGIQVRVLAINGRTREMPGVELFEMRKLSVPGVNSIMDLMRVPVAVPDRALVKRALAGASVLHVQFPLFLGAAAIKEAKDMGVPVISSFHLQPENILRNLKLPNFFFRRWIYGLMRRWVYQRSDRIIAPSPFARELLLREMPVTVDVTVLSNGIPEKQLAAFKLRTRIPDDINVLCVGRLAREKRYDLVIDALAISRAADRFRVTFVGTGPMREALQKRCQILGLNSIFVTPTDAELAELYAGADLFLHAGESELEGMSVMQAMAAGVPVVVSDSADSAASTLLTHQMARFRYPDARHFADQIDRLCGPGGPVEVLSAAGHSAAKSLRFNDSVSQLVQIYRDMIFVEDKSKESDRALA